jgi:hypothetical protein
MEKTVQKLINDLSQQLLQDCNDPYFRDRVQTDLLDKMPKGSVLNSVWDQEQSVQILLSEQHKDGSWGRLHSRDSKSKQKILTTEFGVERALVLGMTSSHDCLKRSADHLSRVLDGSIAISDPPEKNERWPVGVQLWAAATLSQIDALSKILNGIMENWLTVLSASFESGYYDSVAENNCHRQVSGVDVAGSYLTLSNKYVLQLLSSRPELVSLHLQTCWMRWLTALEYGLGYHSVPLNDPQFSKPYALDRWMASWETLLHFPAAKPFFAALIEPLLDQQSLPFGWDFGFFTNQTPRMPIYSKRRSVH